jgi:hypothetical protein
MTLTKFSVPYTILNSAAVGPIIGAIFEGGKRKKAVLADAERLSTLAWRVLLPLPSPFSTL